ncbi:uncharacterized protein LOC119085927 [Bradysia coprophila]|uniref:uncharacterized protein LOC119085927 n=1 Tax=Bradysia coprophila TaxID=38358 RepID=UPI00187DAC98|nr:uncharacterized protein LOC119085927 [Bradysia coprophila]
MASKTKKRKIDVKQKHIDDLPNDVLNEIFKHLAIKTFMRCRRVNKRWKSAIDEYMPRYRVNELVIYNDEDECGVMVDTFFYIDKPIDKDIMFRNSDLKLIQNIPLRLDSLTRLKLEGVLIFRWGSKAKVDLSILNTLTALEHLELPVVNPKNTTISLPVLRILYIYSTGSRRGLTVDCPKLEIFGCEEDLGTIHFVHTQSIKELQIQSVPRNMEEFENVEVFRTSSPHSLFVRILVQLTGLRELHLDEHKHVHVSYYKARKNLNRLIEQKRKLKKINLKIFFYNQLLEDGKTVGDYKIYRKFRNAFDDVVDGDDTDAYDSDE